MTPRTILLVSLIGLPTLIYLAIGGYAIWENGNLGWVWWLTTSCLLTAWGVSHFWPPLSQSARPQHKVNEKSHWTPRDREAAKVIRDYQLKVDGFTAEQLTDPHFYLQQVQELAVDLGRVYRPESSDPLRNLTVPEVLAAVRLAADDMERWMLDSVPGSRMLTIRHWRMLQSAPMWMRRVSETAWGASMLLNPLNIARYFASKWSWGSVAEQLQSEFLAVVYLKFIRQVGTYLIEMNSGRLRGGADAYREAFVKPAEPLPAEEGARPAAEAKPITICLVGQVSSGKSSLVNLLTGKTQAAVDALPETKDVQRYQWEMGSPPVTLVLLDTPGYADSGASKKQLRQIETALEEADAALLVMDAHSPAREADRRLLEELADHYRSKPQLKPPPVIGVLTHVDLLSPPLEWSPPYNWRKPDGAKAQSLHDAVAYTTEVFGASLARVVPICSDERPGRVWGIDEELLPALIDQLDDARSVSLLRAFESRLERGRWKALAGQVGRSGKALLQSWIEERLSPRQGG